MARRSRKKSERKVGYVVIGLGHIAQVAVLPAFRHARENSRLVALVSGDEEKRRKLSKKYRCDAYSYEELDACLAREDVDAAYICEPNDKHAAFAIRCARAGVHVVCEKPLAISEEECRRMIEACEEAGVKLMTAYRLHFEPANLEVVKLIGQGKIGDLRFFSSDFSFQVKEDNIRTAAERGGGPIWDIGVYCINAARYCFRSDPTEVFALRADRPDDPRFKEVHEGMSATLKFPGERLATFNVSFGAAATSTYRIVGTKGDICLDNAYEYVGEREMTVTVQDKSRTRTFGMTDQFAPELIAFSDAVLNDGEVEPDGEEGLRDVRIIDALLRSARDGKPIRLSWTPRRRHPEPAQRIRRPKVREPELVDAEGAVAE
jgi:glucose-fructose oxidoreductase